MDNSKIINIGKYTFWIFFFLGNVCLFGYIFSHNEKFALAGLFLLGLGKFVNIIAIIVLLVYGFNNVEHKIASVKASLIILINLPISIIYALIGLKLLGHLN